MTTIPVTDLKNTSAVSALCRDSDEPILVTKNGRPDFWLVRPEDMERLLAAEERERLYQAVTHSEQQWRAGQATDMRADLAEMRQRYGL